MARLGRGVWRIENDRALVTIELAGMTGYTADLVATSDSCGPPILVRGFSGGIAEATIRGPERASWRPTLVLTWRSDPSVATASDAGLLATDPGMQNAARHVLQGVGAGGRPLGSTSIQSDKRLIDSVAEMRRDNRRITQQTLATWTGCSRAELRGYLRATNRTWRDFLAPL